MKIKLPATAQLAVVFTGLVLLNGCSDSFKNFVNTEMPAAEDTGERTVSTSSVPDCLEHRVRWKGENLIKISWWYTGFGTNWRAIADANPGMQIRRIEIGDVICIPEELVTRQEAMPEGYRIPDLAVNPVDPAKESQPEAVQHTADPLDLFGPVDMREADSLSGDAEHLPLQTID